MSITPGTPEFPNPETPEIVETPPKVGRTWQNRLLRICFAIFTFEIGLFLVVFPWMDDAWDVNYFQSAIPALQNIWGDPYFRGALTGLGLANLYIGCQEVIRLLKRM